LSLQGAALFVAGAFYFSSFFELKKEDIIGKHSSQIAEKLFGAIPA
jgi:hypothetical protein